MNFPEALYFRGINIKKPIEMHLAGATWYGHIVQTKLRAWEFYGIILLANRRGAEHQLVSGTMFGSSIEPQLMFDETLPALQRVNPFVGTTHYPDLAMSMRNISRLKLLWLWTKEGLLTLWQFMTMIRLVTFQKVI